MKDRVIFNGKLIKKEDVRLNLDNRGFRYGDGLFETIRMFDGKLPFFKAHIDRLNQGINCLGFELDFAKNGLDFWKFEIRRIVKFYRQKYPNLPKNYRLRLAVYRNDGGFYTPISSKVSYILELSLLQKSKFEWDKKGVSIGIFPDIRLSTDKLSNLKTANSLPYVLAALYKQKNGFDDCLLLNTNENIAESIHSNIFFIKNNTLITPDLTEGCTRGTTRMMILKIAEDLGLKVEVCICNEALLKTSNEVFLTNAIRGIQWVNNYNEINYTHETTKKIHKKLNQLVKKSIYSI